MATIADSVDLSKDMVVTLTPDDDALHPVRFVMKDDVRLHMVDAFDTIESLTAMSIETLPVTVEWLGRDTIEWDEDLAIDIYIELLHLQSRLLDKYGPGHRIVRKLHGCINTFNASSVIKEPERRKVMVDEVTRGLNWILRQLGQSVRGSGEADGD